MLRPAELKKLSKSHCIVHTVGLENRIHLKTERFKIRISNGLDFKWCPDFEWSAILVRFSNGLDY